MGYCWKTGSGSRWPESRRSTLLRQRSFLLDRRTEEAVPGLAGEEIIDGVHELGLADVAVVIRVDAVEGRLRVASGRFSVYNSM